MRGAEKTLGDAVLMSVPPQNLDAERAALGAALLDADARAVVLRELDARDFFEPRHARLFEVLGDLMLSLEEGEQPDLVTVEAALKAAGCFEEVGGREALIELCDACPIPANAAVYSRIVRQKMEERQARDEAIETLRNVGLEDPAVEDTPTTDLGNAARFARSAAGKARYVGQWGRWILWKRGRWQRDDVFRILVLAKQTARRIFDEAKVTDDPARQQALAKWAVRSQSRERLSAMVDLARPDLAVGVEELDSDPFAFNVLNGTLDLRTGQLHPHRPKDLLTKRANVRFDPAATCPLWDSVLNRSMAGNADLIGYLQRLFGLCLTADIGDQVLPIFYGEGANGKNTLLDTVTGLMGDYAAEAPPDLLLVRRNPEHPTELADLCGRRLVVASETAAGRRLNASLVKRLTGNARLKARYMRADYFEFNRTHKMILHTNHRPTIRETTHAIWRRLQLVPFDVVIPPEEQDRHLVKKLVKERSGILNWMLAGCLAWQRDGLNPPAEVLAATDAYRDEQDLLGEFLNSRCVFGAGVQATRADLFAAYSAWVGEAKEHHPLGRAAFYERIRSRPGVKDAMKRLDGRMTRLFTGIGLLRDGALQP